MSLLPLGPWAGPCAPGGSGPASPGPPLGLPGGGQLLAPLGDAQGSAGLSCDLRAKVSAFLTRIFLGNWHLVRNSNIANDLIRVVGIFPSWENDSASPGASDHSSAPCQLLAVT